MNFNEYAEKAIVRYGLTGYNNLARELGMTKSSISMLRSGKNVPSEETMIKLAELAGLPKEEALIDLNLWRSKNDPKRHEIWLRISKMVGCLLLLIICLLPSFSYAANHNITFYATITATLQSTAWCNHFAVP